MEELCCSEGPHKGVYPHRHDEEDNGHSAAIELLVGKNPCSRVAEEDTQGRVLDRHLERQGKSLYRISVGEEFCKILECKVDGVVAFTKALSIDAVKS